MHTKWFVLGLFITMVALLGCEQRAEQPYRREMDGLMHENGLLKSELLELSRRSAEQIARVEELQKQLEGVRGQVSERDRQLAERDQRLAVMEVEIERLRGELEVIARQREAAEEARRQEELKRQQQLSAVASVNRNATSQPPFRVFDVIYVGKKEIRGRLLDAGRLSIRNYSDQEITVHIEGFPFGEIVRIPPKSATNAVYVSARKGEPAVVQSDGHRETITW